MESIRHLRTGILGGEPSCNGATVVIDYDKNVASVAICSNKDNYWKWRGVSIARERMQNIAGVNGKSAIILIPTSNKVEEWFIAEIVDYCMTKLNVYKQKKSAAVIFGGLDS